MTELCSDIGGVDEGAFLCRMPEGHAYEGLITYRDGRAAEIAPNASSGTGELDFLPAEGAVVDRPPASEPIGTNLLRITEGPHAGVITYTDGRVARIDTEAVPATGDQLVFVGPSGSGRITLSGLNAETIRRTREMQGGWAWRTTYTVTGLSADHIALNRLMSGTVLGSCNSVGTRSSTTALPSALAWTPDHFREIVRVLPLPDAAFYCSDDRSRSIVLQTGSIYRSDMTTAIEASTCGDLDGTHCESFLGVMRTATGAPEPESWLDWITSPAGYLAGGISVFVLGGLGAHIAGARYTARAENADAVREANLEAERASRFAEEANTPDARRQARIARDAARFAEEARRAGRPSRVARHYEERARAAADEAERIAESTRGPDDGDDGNGPSAPVARGPAAPVRRPAGSPGTTARVVLPDATLGILAYHGGRVIPPAEGAPLSSSGVPMIAPGPLPVPLGAGPLTLPRPVVAARPVVLARPVLAVP